MDNKNETIRSKINDLISEIEEIVLKHQTTFSDEARQVWIEYFLNEIHVLKDEQESNRFIGEKIKEIIKECQK